MKFKYVERDVDGLGDLWDWFAFTCDVVALSAESLHMLTVFGCHHLILLSI
jgi:hypothetical protein